MYTKCIHFHDQHRNLYLKTFPNNVLLHSYRIISELHITSETWLPGTVFNAEVSDDRYQVSHHDLDLLYCKKKGSGRTMSMVSNSHSSILRKHRSKSN